MDANSLLALLPPPWNLLVPIVLGFVLRHYGPNLVAMPILQRLLALFSPKPSPSPTPTPALIDPLHPAPVVPASHPALEEILAGVRKLLGKAPLAMFMVLAFALASVGCSTSRTVSDAVRHCPTGPCSSCTCVDETKCPGACPSTSKPSPHPLPAAAPLACACGCSK